MEELRNRRIGLCLSSGFFGFYAHFGFMRALQKVGVEPAAITGCSAGALLGGLWASGLPEESIRRAVFDVRPLDLVDPPRLRELFTGPFGAISGRRMEALLERLLPVRTFEECPIPFATAAFDLARGELRYVESGSLARGIRASSSLPGMFGPASVDGHPCWDGGAAEKIPLGPLLERDDIDTILIGYIARRDRDLPPKSFMGCIRLAIDSLVFKSDQHKVEAARAKGLEVLVVAPKVPRCGPHRMHMGPEIAKVAEQESLRILAESDFGCEDLS